MVWYGMYDTMDGVQTNVTTIFSEKNELFRKNVLECVDMPREIKYFVRRIIQLK